MNPSYIPRVHLAEPVSLHQRRAAAEAATAAVVRLFLAALR
jgi:hypothetical protein